MQITLDQTEIEAAIKAYIIEAAIKAYIKDQGLNFGVKEPDVSLTAGRGPNGITASVDLVNSLIVKLGPGEVEVLANKPKTDLEPFQSGPREVRKVTPELIKQAKEDEVVNEVIEEDDPLFQEEEEPVVTEVTADNLFAV